MAATLEQASVVQDVDHIRISDGRKTMCNDDRRAVFRKLIECLLYFLLRLGIKGRCRFIENDDRRILEEDASDGDTLLLPARKLHAALADLRLIAIRKLSDEIIRRCQTCSLFDLLFGRVLTAIRDILCDGIPEEENILLHDTDLSSEILLAERRKRMSVQHDFAFCRFIEAKQQADERTLPRPRLADESHRLSGRDLKIQIMQDEMSGVIAEG